MNKQMRASTVRVGKQLDPHVWISLNSYTEELFCVAISYQKLTKYNVEINKELESVNLDVCTLNNA